MKKISLILLCFLVLSSCSGETKKETQSIEKVTPSKTIFNYDSLTDIGFKKTKTYKIKDLPKSNSAYFGFLKETKIEYEIRFYDNHQDALEYGQNLAEERTGENAILKKEDATWKEGVKEARSCAGDSGSGKTSYLAAHGAASCMSPKYGDYIIYGNMILLCQGANSEESMLNCTNIINTLANK